MNWKKILRGAACLVLCAVMATACVACKDDSGDPPDPGETQLSGSLTIAIPFSTVDKKAVQALIDAYELKNPRVSVELSDLVTMDTYQDFLRNTLAVDDKNDVPYDICRNSEVQDLFNTKNFVDYSQHLDEVNPYNGAESVWRDGLDPLAYMPNGSQREVYSISFETSKVLIYYNKDLCDEAGVDPSQIKDWLGFRDALKKVKEHTYTGEDGVDYNVVPFSLGGGGDSFTNTMMSWLIRAYADQYVRSAAEEFHARENDYFYDPEVDAAWELQYKPAGENPGEEEWDAAYFNDNVANYTYNPLRLLDAYQKGTVGPWTDVFKSIYANLLEIVPEYTVASDQNSPAGTFQAKDWSKAWVDFWSGTGNAAFILQTNAYTDYQTFLQINGDKMFQLGEMELPPMTAHSAYPDVKPEADYVRTIGGPFGYYAIVNKNAKQNALALDFMKYWSSSEGQNVLMQAYSDLKSCITGAPLVKNVTIPDGVLQLQNSKIRGLVEDNPINQISQGLKLAESTTIYKSLMQKLFSDATAAPTKSYIDGGVKSFQAALTTRKLIDKYLSNQNYRPNALENLAGNPF